LPQGSSSRSSELQVSIYYCLLRGLIGAGKTTLLNYLSGREISQNLNKKGKIYINGVEREQMKGFSALSAYVQQDDILFQTMTVRECLEFAAKLKLKGTHDEKM
jgi:ABC-type multidrug transport system ATPase subunit